MNMYSIKMRASKNSRHISGAEKIIPAASVPEAVNMLTDRALHHALGQADFVNVKIEAVKDDELLHLQALPVSSSTAATVEASFALMRSLLQQLKITSPESIIDLLRQTKPMRGAILYDIATNKRLELDQERGIRVTYMDAAQSSPDSSRKNHFREALVLATKVANTPGMLAEICISDDPDYVTGYLASKQHGYVRLSPLKNSGDSHGGRIFIFDSSQGDPAAAIDYLERKKVLVDDVPATSTPSPDMRTELASELQQLQKKRLHRSMRIMDSQQSSHVHTEGRKMLLLSSNSYLDLAAAPEVKKAAAEAALTWGAGSGGSRLTTGTLQLHRQLEKALARFKHTEDALLFNTGYTANVGIISALADKDSVIFSDEYNHASIIDGCRLSGARTVIYKHNDMADLETKLQQTAFQKGLIVSDAVFSMDGDIADLPRLTELGRRYGLLTMLDEAHATGVIGATGKGIAEYYGYTCQADITMGTLSKALGSEGGFVCADSLIIEYLTNKARSFIFSTSQCPAAVGAALKSLELLENEPDRVCRLQHNIKFFCNCLRQNGIDAYSETAIVPVIIGDEATALLIAQELYEQGILIPAIRYPTVAKGSARLRAALMSTHTEAELKQAAAAISTAIAKHKK